MAAHKLESATILLKRGARLDSKDDMDRIPLYLAVETGALDVVRLFVDGHAPKAQEVAFSLATARISEPNLNTRA